MACYSWRRDSSLHRSLGRRPLVLEERLPSRVASLRLLRDLRWACHRRPMPGAWSRGSCRPSSSLAWSPLRRRRVQGASAFLAPSSWAAQEAVVLSAFRARIAPLGRERSSLQTALRHRRLPCICHRPAVCCRSRPRRVLAGRLRGDRQRVLNLRRAAQFRCATFLSRQRAQGRQHRGALDPNTLVGWSTAARVP